MDIATDSNGTRRNAYASTLRRAASWVGRGIAGLAACVPMLVSAQAVDGLNAKYVKTGFANIVETEVGRWLLNGNASNPYSEVERNEATIRLKNATGSTIRLDIQKREFWMTAPNMTQHSAIPITGVYKVSGFNANYVHVGLLEPVPPTTAGQVPTLQWVGVFGVAELIENGISQGAWRIDAAHMGDMMMSQRYVLPSFTPTIPSSVVQRTADTISFAETGVAGAKRFTINVITGECQYPGRICQLLGAHAATGENAGQINWREANPHGAQYPAMLGKLVKTSAAGDWVMETAKGPAIKWKEVGRATTYLDLALAFNGDKVRLFTDGSTQKWTNNTWVPDPTVTVQFTAPVWKGQLGTIFEPVSPGISPGFQVQNKTDYPVLVTLEQLGCLYYEIVQPGKVFQRNTGAVWFTIKATMSADLKEPTVASCIRQPAMFAGKILLVGAVTVASGGAAALAIPAMLMTAAGEGAAIATQNDVLSGGGSAGDGTAAKVRVSMLSDGFRTVGMAFLTGNPVFAAGAVVNGGVLGLPAGAVAGQLADWYAEEPTQAKIDRMQSEFEQQATVTGAYAGYPWPWKMADRVMPRYDITGGPRIKTTPNGSTIVLGQEKPLTISRVN